MDRNKKIGIGLIGNFMSAFQFYKKICIARQDSLQLRHFPVEYITHLKGNAQCNIFLFGKAADGSGIFAPVTGIQYYLTYYFLRQGLLSASYHYQY
ncbi:hypothetical protein D3C80_1717070 [compost metagenome]